MMRLSTLRSRLAALAAVTLLTGCASMRGAEVQSESGPVYTLEVVNAASYEMRVSYSDGPNSFTLGNVRAGATQTFVITSPASTSITVTGTDSSGNRPSRSEVRLRSGSSVTVRLGG